MEYNTPILNLKTTASVNEGPHTKPLTYTKAVQNIGQGIMYKNALVT